MKRILTCALSFISLYANAQYAFNNTNKRNLFYAPVSDIVLITYYDYGFGVGASYDKAFADTKRHDAHPGFNFNFTYNFTPFLPLAAEFQFGTLSGGGRTVDKDAYGRYFKNAYKAMVIRADALFGSFINYSDSDVLTALKDLYVGCGAGVIGNNLVDVQRTNLIAANGPLNYTFPGKDNGLNPLVALRVGYDLKINNNFDEPRYHINIGYQYNVTFGEGLDGYNDDPKVFKNNSPDQYGQIMLVFRMDFGQTSVYSKYEGLR